MQPNQQPPQPPQAPQQPGGGAYPGATGVPATGSATPPPPAPQRVAQPGQQMTSGQTPATPPQTTKTKSPPQNTTQRSLLFSELRDDLVIMADGSFRAVIACDSINFDLMSNREREGVEYSYQNFLNSLMFDIQILVRSQRVDIAPYMDKLTDIRRSQDNMLLNVLMDDYLGFIEQLAEEANIMDKTFFIVVPYYPAGDATKIVDKGKGFFGKFFSNSAPTVTHIDQQTYEKALDEVKNRVESVTSGLFQIGVRCARLNTKELGELYYNVYNPDTAVSQPLGNFENQTSTFVRKAPSEAEQQGEYRG